jgi:hypothetical protein
VLPCADPALGFPGIDDKVEQLKKELPNVHVLDQFSNKANREAHIRWTGTVMERVKKGWQLWLSKQESPSVYLTFFYVSTCKMALGAFPFFFFSNDTATWQHDCFLNPECYR